MAGRHVRRIVEFGVGLATRSQRMIEIASARAGAANVTFTGIDLFELRSADDGPGLSLKLAHRQLVATGARIRLVPGDPYVALARSPNALGTADLVVIAADQDRRALDRAWFYIERLLDKDSLLLLEAAGATGGSKFQPVARSEVQKWAGVGQRRRAG